MMTRILMALAVALLSLAPQFASAARIELLGETFLSNNPERDSIRVQSCDFGNERVAAVKVRVLGDKARIDHLEVVYGNGERDALPVRSMFRPGDESRWIDLRGHFRCVKKVKIWGESGNRPRQTRVQIWGFTKKNR